KLPSQQRCQEPINAGELIRGQPRPWERNTGRNTEESAVGALRRAGRRCILLTSRSFARPEILCVFPARIPHWLLASAVSPRQARAVKTYPLVSPPAVLG